MRVFRQRADLPGVQRHAAPPRCEVNLDPRRVASRTTTVTWYSRDQPGLVGTALRIDTVYHSLTGSLAHTTAMQLRVSTYMRYSVMRLPLVTNLWRIRGYS